jgi:uncharacterized membrane protein SirB2
MSYLAIKHLHVTCAALSGMLFLARGMLMLKESPALQQPWLRIMPHIIDTILLVSAITMAVWSMQFPFEQNWLTAKLIALVAYVIVGSIALKRGKTKRVRSVAFIVALLLFIYIVKVALTRQVL